MDKNIKEILTQIENKKQELKNLEDSLIKTENDEFQHLVGKFYSQAASSICYVDKINYIDDYRVHVEGISVYGGIKYTNNFSIDVYDELSFDKDYLPREITKDEFIKTLSEWMREIKDSTITKISKVITNMNEL